MKHQALKGAKPNVKCLTRFICGISMPLFKKAKVCQLDDFAALTDCPYYEELEPATSTQGQCIFLPAPQYSLSLIAADCIRTVASAVMIKPLRPGQMAS